MSFDDFMTVVCGIYHEYWASDSRSGKNWPECLEVQWTLGGQTGNGWTGNAINAINDPIDAEPEPDLELDALFESICPNITYIRYRKVMKSCLERDNNRDSGYYGDYRNVGIKRVNYQKLYNTFVEMKLI